MTSIDPSSPLSEGLSVGASKPTHEAIKQALELQGAQETLGTTLDLVMQAQGLQLQQTRSDRKSVV